MRVASLSQLQNQQNISKYYVKVENIFKEIGAMVFQIMINIKYVFQIEEGNRV